MSVQFIEKKKDIKMKKIILLLTLTQVALATPHYSQEIQKISCEKSDSQKIMTALAQLEPLSKEYVSALNEEKIKMALLKDDPKMVVTVAFWPEHLKGKLPGWQIYEDCAVKYKKYVSEEKDKAKKLKSWKNCVLSMRHDEIPPVLNKIFKCLN